MGEMANGCLILAIGSILYPRCVKMLKMKTKHNILEMTTGAHIISYRATSKIFYGRFIKRRGGLGNGGAVGMQGDMLRGRNGVVDVHVWEATVARGLEEAWGHMKSSNLDNYDLMDLTRRMSRAGFDGHVVQTDV